jgi:hypothetical protein
VEREVGIGLSAIALVVGMPLLMLGVIWLLGELEAWMLQPDERAAAVHDLLEQEDEADDVEAAVARLLAPVADPPNDRR